MDLFMPFLGVSRDFSDPILPSKRLENFTTKISGVSKAYCKIPTTMAHEWDSYNELL
jgi:hypothetical protein